MYYLGIDLGGTKIAAAVINSEGVILSRGQVSTPRTGPTAVASAMAAAAELALEQIGLQRSDLKAAGIGAPGIVSPTRGEVIYWSNLNFRHVALADMLTELLCVPVFLENDANAAALGEYAAGAGKDASSLVAITLGTGIGGGAVLDGRLYAGFNHSGMELGHMVINPNGPLCTCGRRGCFETYASASALLSQARQAMKTQPDCLLWQLTQGFPERMDGAMIFTACDKGDALANKLLARYQVHLARGIVNCINLLQPEVLCVGGGLAAAGERLLKPVREILDREDYARFHKRRTKLVLAKLGNDAGLVGAGLLPTLSMGGE